MSGKIRGHYRIEPNGRAMLMSDVNAAMRAYSIPLQLLRDKAAEQRARITKMSMVGLALFSMGIVVVIALPQIQKSMVAAQASRIASARSAFFQNHPEFRSRRSHHPFAE